MDHQSLVPLAQRAILQVLNYHFQSAENGCGLPALDQQTRDSISADIQKNLPLAAYAVDKQKAYLEIICDAALPVAQKYSINKRWFYTAVQGMTSMELVPSIYENVDDPVRLSISNLQNDDGIASFNGQEMDHDEEEEEEGAQPPALVTNVVPPLKNKGLHWSDNEIQKLIDLYVTGPGFSAIADQLGRSRNAVQVTWRRVNASGSTWKDYIESKRIAMAVEQNEEVEQASESDDSDESESGEREEVDEAGEQAQPQDQATTAATAAASSAVPEPKRPWTDADMRELIELKFGGMSTSAMAKLMRRAHGSVHCTWLNAAGNTSSRWFKYIHKKFRAEMKKEKQAKASQGADANGESGSVSISLFI
jgi:transposase